MIALLQRVSTAKVEISGDVIGQIERGLLLLIGIEKEDDEAKAERLAQRILTYRVFPDQEDKMNLSVQDIHGSILLVPQFTLAADTQKGSRPSFSSAASPEQAKLLFEYLVKHSQRQYPHIATGEFAADMQVSLCNDGPVTFWLQV